MATEDRTGKAVEALKAKVAAKRRGAAGKQAMVQAGVEFIAGTSAPTPIVPSDAGLGEDEITPAAKNELERLASASALRLTWTSEQVDNEQVDKRAEANASPPDGGATSDGSGEEPDEEGEDAETSDGSGDEEQSVMEGLQAGGGAGANTGVGGGALYEKRQAEIAAARARPGGKGGKATKASGKASGKATKAGLKEKIRAQKEKEKAKTREKSEKQKEKEAERKARAKVAADERRAKEKKRKDEQAALAKERARERMEKRVPDLLARENKALQAAFAEDYAVAGPKTDRNPGGIGIRRAKADRGDFAAGYIMALRRVRKQAREQGDGSLAAAAGAAA